MNYIIQLTYITYNALRCQLFRASFCGDLNLSLRPGDREPGPLTHPRANCLRFCGRGTTLNCLYTKTSIPSRDWGWITATRKLDLSFRFVQHRRDSRRDPLRPRSRNLGDISMDSAAPQAASIGSLLRPAYPYKGRDEANYVVMRVSLS